MVKDRSEELRQGEGGEEKQEEHDSGECSGVPTLLAFYHMSEDQVGRAIQIFTAGQVCSCSTWRRESAWSNQEKLKIRIKREKSLSVTKDSSNYCAFFKATRY